MMKLVVFDVGNGSCALLVDPNGNSVMFDCGSHANKDNPVDKIKNLRSGDNWLSHMSDYNSQKGVSYPLTKLVISHPDVDHIKNAHRVQKELTPAQLLRRRLEEFPQDLIADSDNHLKDYKNLLCDKYINPSSENIEWSFNYSPYMIPMNTLKNLDNFPHGKTKNNSSIIYWVEFSNRRFLFSGDMEEPGWEWLIKNNEEFVDNIEKGVDVLIASHHGHTSGYSAKLMQFMGHPSLSVLSKGSETGRDTDVDSRYSAKSTGQKVTNLRSKETAVKYTVTTRSNGHIFMEVEQSGELSVYTQK